MSGNQGSDCVLDQRAAPAALAQRATQRDDAVRPHALSAARAVAPDALIHPRLD
jgi:hypothetical protein